MAVLLLALEERERGEAWRHAEVLYSGLAPHTGKHRLTVEEMVPEIYRSQKTTESPTDRLSRIRAS